MLLFVCVSVFLHLVSRCSLRQTNCLLHSYSPSQLDLHRTEHYVLVIFCTSVHTASTRGNVCVCSYICLKRFVLGYLLIVFDLYARVIRHNFNDMVFWYVNECIERAFLFHFSMDCSTIATHLHESNAPLHALGDSAVPCSLADSSCARFSFHFCTIVFSIWITLFSLGSQLGIEICWFFLLNWCEMVSFLACNPQNKRVTMCIHLQPFSNIQRPYTTRIIISSIFTAFYFIRLKQNSISMFVLFFAFHFFFCSCCASQAAHRGASLSHPNAPSTITTTNRFPERNGVLNKKHHFYLWNKKNYIWMKITTIRFRLSRSL